MIRTALSALLLAAVVSPAAAQLAATPALKREVTVSSDIVRIGDLIENAGPAAATPIFRAPELGRVGALPAQRVLDAVLQHGLIVVDARGIGEVTVTRSARVIAVGGNRGPHRARARRTQHARRCEEPQGRVRPRGAADRARSDRSPRISRSRA